MTSLFDPLNLVLLAIALGVFWRLKSVLGTRTGAERPPADVTILRPQRETVTPPREGPELGVQDHEPAKPVWHGIATEGSDTAKALDAIAARSREFNIQEFLGGAKRAYELVLQAYANGDKPALKSLLGSEVFQSFSGAIDNRKADETRFVFQFVGVKSALLNRAVLDDHNAMLTVQFDSEMIQALVSKDGNVIDGDDKTIRQVQDVWTFERDVTSRDPNWKLVATEDDIG